jgi:hypothetical protein
MRTAILAVSLLAAGCSSAPKIAAEKPQYCYTYQTIETENREQVNSKVRVECTDDQIERLTSKRLGMSPNCGEFSYYMQIGGRNVQRKGISCQKPDGSWEIVNTIGHIVQ